MPLIKHTQERIQILLEFGEITLEALPAIRSIVKTAGCQSSAYSCYNLYCLREKYGARCAIIDDTLFARRLAGDFNGYAVYLPPVGRMDMREAVGLIAADARADGKRAFFFGVTERQLQFFGSGFKKEANRDWADYIYHRVSLAELSGAGLRQRRKEYKKFARAYPDYELEEISVDNLREIAEFQHNWYDANYNRNRVSLEYENRGILESFNAWRELHMHGVLVRVNGRVAAYNTGTALNNEMFVSHVQKADISYTKIYTAITRLFSQSVCEKFRLLNLEEDIGLAGLRAAKLYYRPCELLMKYNVMELDAFEQARG